MKRHGLTKAGRKNRRKDFRRTQDNLRVLKGGFRLFVEHFMPEFKRPELDLDFSKALEGIKRRICAAFAIHPRLLGVDLAKSGGGDSKVVVMEKQEDGELKILVIDDPHDLSGVKRVTKMTDEELERASATAQFSIAKRMYMPGPGRIPS